MILYGGRGSVGVDGPHHTIQVSRWRQTGSFVRSWHAQGMYVGVLVILGKEGKGGQGGKGKKGEPVVDEI